MVQYESELLHHGVKGMKWGVRKYQNPDGSLTDVGKRQSGLRVRWGMRGGGLIGSKAKRQMVKQNAAKQRKFNKKVSEHLGWGRQATYHTLKSQKRSILAKKARTDIGKKYQERRSFNDAQKAKYDRKRQNMSIPQRIGENIIPMKMLTMPYKSVITGKTSTYGHALVKKIVAGAAAGVAISSISKRIARKKMGF